MSSRRKLKQVTVRQEDRRMFQPRTTCSLFAATRSATTPETSPRIHARIRHGLKRRDQWLQVAKFCTVGAAGYVVNICIFTLFLKLTTSHHLIAATVAFAGAVVHNFWWNRHWTFIASEAQARLQVLRFFAVSIAAFTLAAAFLELLVTVIGLPKLVAQAISIVVATPFNFMGNKLWAFRRAGSSIRQARSHQAGTATRLRRSFGGTGGTGSTASAFVHDRHR
jgi:putative flippase GtrA